MKTTIPWCPWCKSWHGPKAPHISKTKWLLVVDEGLLFDTKKDAKAMGYDASNHPIIKVEVKPIQ